MQHSRNPMQASAYLVNRTSLFVHVCSNIHLKIFVVSSLLDTRYAVNKLNDACHFSYGYPNKLLDTETRTRLSFVLRPKFIRTKFGTHRPTTSLLGISIDSTNYVGMHRKVCQPLMFE